MPLSERAQAILAVTERELPSRKAAVTFAEKLDLLDRLKAATNEYEQTCSLDDSENA
jgi:hypothetical protein